MPVEHQLVLDDVVRRLGVHRVLGHPAAGDVDHGPVTAELRADVEAVLEVAGGGVLRHRWGGLPSRTATLPGRSAIGRPPRPTPWRPLAPMLCPGQPSGSGREARSSCETTAVVSSKVAGVGHAAWVSTPLPRTTCAPACAGVSATRSSGTTRSSSPRPSRRPSSPGWWPTSVLDLPQPFLAPWAALLVVHATVFRTFSQGARQVAATALGVVLAWLVGDALGLDTRLGRRRAGARARRRGLHVVRGPGDHHRGHRPGRAHHRLLAGRQHAGLPAARHRHRHRGRPARQRRGVAAAAPADGHRGDRQGRRPHRPAADPDARGPAPGPDAVDEEMVDGWVEETRSLDGDLDDAWALVRQAQESARMNPRRSARQVRQPQQWFTLLHRMEQAVAEQRSMARTLGRSLERGKQWDDTFRHGWLDLLRDAGRAIQDARPRGPARRTRTSRRPGAAARGGWTRCHRCGPSTAHCCSTCATSWTPWTRWPRPTRWGSRRFPCALPAADDAVRRRRRAAPERGGTHPRGPGRLGRPVPGVAPGAVVWRGTASSPARG